MEQRSSVVSSPLLLSSRPSVPVPVAEGGWERILAAGSLGGEEGREIVVVAEGGWERILAAGSLGGEEGGEMVVVRTEIAEVMG